jgi:hypothetical protein
VDCIQKDADVPRRVGETSTNTLGHLTRQGVMRSMAKILENDFYVVLEDYMSSLGD